MLSPCDDTLYLQLQRYVYFCLPANKLNYYYWPLWQRIPVCIHERSTDTVLKQPDSVLNENLPLCNNGLMQSQTMRGKIVFNHCIHSSCNAQNLCTLHSLKCKIQILFLPKFLSTISFVSLSLKLLYSRYSTTPDTFASRLYEVTITIKNVNSYGNVFLLLWTISWTSLCFHTTSIVRFIKL